MKLRVLLLETGKQVCEITEWQLCIQAARNVKLSCAFFNGLTGYAQAIVDVMRVGVRLSWSAIEAAKFAVGVTDIRWIQMPIDVEVSRTAVSPPSHDVRQFAECGKIVSGIKSDAIGKGETLSGRDALGYLVKVFVV